MASENIQFVAKAALAVAVIGGLVYGGVEIGESYYHQREVTATVRNEARVCSSGNNGSSTCKYLIFTNKGTFEDTDSLVNGKFNSSDIFGELEPGHTYTFKVYGFRSGFMSAYPNIVSVKGF